MTTFVLVHGAFRGGWGWARVRSLLTAAGCDVHAPSLIGAGEHASRVGEATSLNVWADQIAALIELEDLRGVVLVGHSQGGLVTASVAARIPERIGLLVHLDAAVPAPGQRAVDLLSHAGGLPPRDLVVPSRPVAAHEYDTETAAWVNARLVASPAGPALDPVPAVPGSVREEYVFCARTPDGYPSEVTRTRLEAEGRDYLTIDATHDAPIVAAPDVARVLLELAMTVPTKGN